MAPAVRGDFYCARRASGQRPRLDVEDVRWVGTSMGGLIGMALAAQPSTPVRRLVLNDAGPVVAGEGDDFLPGHDRGRVEIAQ